MIGARGIGGAALVVVEGEDDDGFGAGEDEGGVGAAFGIAGEPGHVAVFAFGDPLLKEGAMRGGLRGGDAAVVKAEGAGLGDEGGLELLGREMGDGRWKIGGQRRR